MRDSKGHQLYQVVYHCTDKETGKITSYATMEGKVWFYCQKCTRLYKFPLPVD